MRIHVTGSDWQGCITSNLARAFRELGHTVFVFEKNGSKIERRVAAIASRLVRKPYEAENYFFRLRSEKWLKSVGAFGADLIFIEDAPNILAEFIRRARDFKKPIFYYEVGPPHGPGAREELLNFKYVDEVFCMERDWNKYIEFFFPRRVRYLPLAGNNLDFYPISDTEKLYDVTFVGSAPEQSPDGLIRAHMLNSISDTYRVGIWGNGWNYWLRHFPRLKSRIKSGSAVSNKEANKIYNQTKISFTYHTTGVPTFIGPRTFDIALAGCFQIIDYRPGSDFDILFPKNTFPTYKTIPEIQQLIEDWLPRDNERKEIASVLRDHVLKHHTWKHRAEEVLKVADSYFGRV